MLTSYTLWCSLGALERLADHRSFGILAAVGVGILGGCKAFPACLMVPFLAPGVDFLLCAAMNLLVTCNTMMISQGAATRPEGKEGNERRERLEGLEGKKGDEGKEAREGSEVGPITVL